MDKIIIESCSDCQVVINEPEYHLRHVWPKRGAKFAIDRDILEQIFYNQGVANLFFHGYLKTNDEEFMRAVGLINEADERVVFDLTQNIMQRMLRVMPLSEFKETLKKLTHDQAVQFADYAVDHYQELSMDRVELLTKASGRNILKTIELAKADEE